MAKLADRLKRVLDDDDLVTVVNFNVSHGVFEFTVGELDLIVTVELGRFLDSNDTKFYRSHAIKTPTQLGPYLPSRTFEDTPEAALCTAVSSITDYFRRAVDAGHVPAEEWLVPTRL